MKLEQMKIKELLDTSHTIAEKLFEGHENTRRLERISGFTRQHRWLPPLPWADL